MNFTKHLTYTLAFILVGSMAYAQSSKVTNAKFSYDAAMEKLQAEDIPGAAKELGEAIEEITPAIAHEKTMMKEKTWRYRASIYEMIARNLDKPEIAALSDDPVGIAASSYQKAMELDSKGSYEVENKRGLLVMQNLAMNTGIQKYNEQDYAMAFRMFKKSDELSTGMGLTDTMAIYNAALSADRAKDYAGALEYYKKADAINFQEPAIYNFMSVIYKAQGDTSAADEAIINGRKKFPSDQGLLIDEVNIYLGRGELEKALENLKLTVEQDPENYELIYNVGAVYDNIGNKDKARESYQRSIDINADYFDSNYNLGASYFNEAVELINEANNIPTHKVKEYQAAKAAADDVMATAQPFLEKAHEIDPVDRSTMVSLAEIYARTSQLEKRKAIMAKMNN